MFPKDDGKESEAKKTRQRRQKLVRYWWITLIVFYIIFGSFLVGVNYENKQSDDLKHFNEINQDINGSYPTLDDMGLLANAIPTKVTSGIYLGSIPNLSLKDSIWDVDFFIWFKWSGDKVNPENFRIVDGNINEKVEMGRYDNGTEHYRLYKVTGTINKIFDIDRFPLDSNVLTIKIKDNSNLRTDLLYVPDNNDSNISSIAKIPGYQLGRIGVRENPSEFRGKLGDPRLESYSNSTYSQLTASIPIHRPDLGFFFRLFLGMFFAMGVAFIAMLKRPVDGTRFGLIGSALFAAVGNMIIVSSLVPNTGISTLADMVNALSMVTILLILLESTILFHFYNLKDEEELFIRLDQVSFVIIALSFVVILVLMVAVAW
jgi:hypothetical protein